MHEFKACFRNVISMDFSFHKANIDIMMTGRHNLEIRDKLEE
jgi:hypothetical protein